ncbi:hypothetical protein HanRHA438_Chr12g0559791 [Helianthus annuus]|nr:hypothetical protein HanRHA438_Chr12g0559791 [Helianthus annuus]
MNISSCFLKNSHAMSDDETTMTWVDGPRRTQRTGVLNRSISLSIHRKVGLFRSNWMAHPKNGKGVGPGGNGHDKWLVDFLFRNLPTNMSMMTMRMIVRYMITDVEDKRC